jgi:DNA polymerase-4
MMEVIGDFSPVVEQISVDEAFLDMSGTEALFGPPAATARKLKEAVFRELGLTASVGVAPNKFLAKIASDLNKPDGLTEVRPETVLDFLAPLPVERLIGVGRRTAPELHRLGLHSIGQVRAFGREELESALGADFGSQLHSLSRGEDPREVESDWREKSISHEITFEEDLSDLEALGSVLLDLCDRVARRARKAGLAGRTVSLVWRDPDFSRHSRSRTLGEPTQNSRVLFAVAQPLLTETAQAAARSLKRRKFRLLGLRLSGFASEGEQLSLFASNAAAALDKAMDAVRDRFGEKRIQRGRLLDAAANPEEDVRL